VYPLRPTEVNPLTWQASFEEELILKAFKVTGIWPMDRKVALKRFAHTTSNRGSKY
jgi:hypothetical protein